MNTIGMNEGGAGLRLLQDGELDAVSGGEVGCTAQYTSILTDKGMLTIGTKDCGNGMILPFAAWNPAPQRS